MAAIKKRATLAALALLGIIPKNYAEETVPETDGWSIDSSLLSYSESNRISIFEPTISLHKDFLENQVLDLSFTVDTVSGVTPIGTLPKKKPTTPAAQTITAASGGGGGGSSSSGGGGGSSGVTLDVPTAYMADVRYGFTSAWQQPLSFGVIGKVGGNISIEKDFRSMGVNLMLLRDFNQKNTTLSIGISPETDKINPKGGVPLAFTDPSSVGSNGPSFSTKKNLSLLIGVTQVLSPVTLMQFNYSQTRENGDLADPYKLLSLMDPVTGDPLSSLYEKRPQTRNGHSYYWLTRMHVSGDVLSTAYRFYSDDWGIQSHTFDLNYHWNYSHDVFFEPHVRLYHQTQADFFKIGLINGDTLPQFASADYRLAEFNAYTFGMRYGYKFGDKSLLVLRFDYYTQVGNSHPAGAIGNQKDFDLFPALRALIFQAQLSFDPSKISDDITTALQ